MEYLYDHGRFAELPYEEIFSSYHHHYPAMFEMINSTASAGDFYREAEEETVLP
jgi:hypothetical protein